MQNGELERPKGEREKGHKHKLSKLYMIFSISYNRSVPAETDGAREMKKRGLLPPGSISVAKASCSSQVPSLSAELNIQVTKEQSYRKVSLVSSEEHEADDRQLSGSVVDRNPVRTVSMIEFTHNVHAVSGNWSPLHRDQSAKNKKHRKY